MSTLIPYIVLGLAFGGVYALSAVGTVVLFRTTAVLNFASGAVGAFGALVAWTVIQQRGAPAWSGYLAALAAGTLITYLYGAVLGPRFAARDELVKAMGTLGLLLVILGVMSVVWGNDVRTLVLPTSKISVRIGQATVTGTQLTAIALALFVTAATSVFLQRTKLGTAMRSLADNRDVTAMLGVPVRRVEAITWIVSGLLASATGLLMAGLVGLDILNLTYLIIPALAAAVIGRLQALWVTFFAGLAIGVVQSVLNSVDSVSEYRNMTPFVIAIAMLLWLAWRRPAATRV